MHISANYVAQNLGLSYMESYIVAISYYYESESFINMLAERGFNT